MVTNTSVVGNLNVGAEKQALDVSSLIAGQWNSDFSIQSDAILVTVIATSVPSSLDVSVVGIDQESGLETSVLAFPQITGPAGSLLLRRSGTAPAGLRLKAVLGTGGGEFRIKVRAVNSGTSDTKILGSNGLTTSQVDVSTIPVVLIAAALVDRVGVCIKHWLNSGAGNLYVAESAIAADPATAWPLALKDAIAMDVAAGVAIWGVTDSGTSDVRISEVGG